MKSIKLVLMSLLVSSVIFVSSCGNSNQNSLMVTESTEIKSVSEETKASETKLETTESKEIITTSEQSANNETQQEVVTNAETNANEISEGNSMPGNGILVAYFSATGTTKRVAEKIAELTSGDLYEIVPANPYSDADLNWNDRNSRSTKEMDDLNVRPEIGSNDIDLTPYTTIYLGYPIWWGDAPRIMATFVEKYNFDGKKVISFCTSGGSGIGRSGSNLGTLAGSGSFVSGERLNSSADTNNVQNFINNNK